MEQFPATIAIAVTVVLVIAFQVKRFLGPSELINQQTNNNSTGNETFTYAIFMKNNIIKAIDINRNEQIELFIAELISSGYTKQSEIQASTMEDAINSYNESLKKSPLEKANETIRLANVRIHELKLELDALNKTCESQTQQIHELKIKNNTNSDEFTPYQWLGFNELPSKHELKAKYKRLTQIHHPDKGGCHKLMCKLNDSYDLIIKQHFN